MKYKKINLSEFRQRDNMENAARHYTQYINDLINKKQHVYIIVKSRITKKILIQRVLKTALDTGVDNNLELVCILDPVPFNTVFRINIQSVDRCMVVYNEV